MRRYENEKMKYTQSALVEKTRQNRTKQKNNNNTIHTSTSLDEKPSSSQIIIFVCVIVSVYSYIPKKTKWEKNYLIM